MDSREHSEDEDSEGERRLPPNLTQDTVAMDADDDDDELDRVAEIGRQLDQFDDEAERAQANQQRALRRTRAVMDGADAGEDVSDVPAARWQDELDEMVPEEEELPHEAIMPVPDRLNYIQSRQRLQQYYGQAAAAGAGEGAAAAAAESASARRAVLHRPLDYSSVAALPPRPSPVDIHSRSTSAAVPEPSPEEQQLIRQRSEEQARETTAAAIGMGADSLDRLLAGKDVGEFDVVRAERYVASLGGTGALQPPRAMAAAAAMARAAGKAAGPGAGSVHPVRAIRVIIGYVEAAMARFRTEMRGTEGGASDSVKGNILGASSARHAIELAYRAVTSTALELDAVRAAGRRARVGMRWLDAKRRAASELCAGERSTLTLNMLRELAVASGVSAAEAMRKGHAELCVLLGQGAVSEANRSMGPSAIAPGNPLTGRPDVMRNIMSYVKDDPETGASLVATVLRVPRVVETRDQFVLHLSRLSLPIRPKTDEARLVRGFMDRGTPKNSTVRIPAEHGGDHSTLRIFSAPKPSSRPLHGRGDTHALITWLQQAVPRPIVRCAVYQKARFAHQTSLSLYDARRDPAWADILARQGAEPEVTVVYAALLEEAEQDPSEDAQGPSLPPQRARGLEGEQTLYAPVDIEPQGRQGSAAASHLLALPRVAVLAVPQNEPPYLDTHGNYDVRLGDVVRSLLVFTDPVLGKQRAVGLPQVVLDAKLVPKGRGRWRLWIAAEMPTRYQSAAEAREQNDEGEDPYIIHSPVAWSYEIGRPQASGAAAASSASSSPFILSRTSDTELRYEVDDMEIAAGPGDRGFFIGQAQSMDDASPVSGGLMASIPGTVDAEALPAREGGLVRFLPNSTVSDTAAVAVEPEGFEGPPRSYVVVGQSRARGGYHAYDQMSKPGVYDFGITVQYGRHDDRHNFDSDVPKATGSAFVDGVGGAEHSRPDLLAVHAYVWNDRCFLLGLRRDTNDQRLRPIASVHARLPFVSHTNSIGFTLEGTDWDTEMHTGLRTRQGLSSMRMIRGMVPELEAVRAGAGAAAAGAGTAAAGAGGGDGDAGAAGVGGDSDGDGDAGAAAAVASTTAGIEAARRVAAQQASRSLRRVRMDEVGEDSEQEEEGEAGGAPGASGRTSPKRSRR